MMGKGDAGWFSEEWVGQGAAIAFEFTERLVDEQSPYQRVEVFQTTQFGKLLTLDGLVMLTTRDNFLYHEMISHPALLTHPAPRDVLIIGGGDCDTMREVLRHEGVERVTQVELDEVVTRVSEVHFPELCASNGDPRAAFHYEDGIEWVARAADASYDIVLIDGSDPIGPAAALFSPAFYLDCHRILRDGGILCGQTESPLFHLDLISHVHETATAAGFTASRTMFFPQCVYPSGWWTVTLSRKDAEIPTQPVRTLPDSIETMYYNDAIHSAAFAAPAFVARALARPTKSSPPRET